MRDFFFVLCRLHACRSFKCSFDTTCKANSSYRWHNNRYLYTMWGLKTKMISKEVLKLPLVANKLNTVNLFNYRVTFRGLKMFGYLSCERLTTLFTFNRFIRIRIVTIMQKNGNMGYPWRSQMFMINEIICSENVVCIILLLNLFMQDASGSFMMLYINRIRHLRMFLYFVEWCKIIFLFSYSCFVRWKQEYILSLCRPEFFYHYIFAGRKLDLEAITGKTAIDWLTLYWKQSKNFWQLINS